MLFSRSADLLSVVVRISSNLVPTRRNLRSRRSMLGKDVVDRFPGLRFVQRNTSLVRLHFDCTPAVVNGSAACTGS